MIPQFLLSRHLTPQRKLRGQRRYFARVARDAATFELDRLGLDHFHPFNFWHYHADWPGWGNRGWSWRKPHVEALAVVFRHIVASRARMRGPFQTWILLADHAGEDAVYLHSPDETAGRPPAAFDFEDSRFPSLEREFARLLPGMNPVVREHRDLDDSAEPPRVTSAIIVYVEGIGLPLESDPPVAG